MGRLMRRSKWRLAQVVGLLVATIARTSSAQDGAATPHAHSGEGDANFFQPPEDQEIEDGTLAPGTIAVDLRDADDHPVPNEIVTLGALINSIAKGDTRKHFQATADERGHAVFSGLEVASNIAYRVSCGYQGGAFAATPFQIPQGKAIRVVLHVYPVTRSLASAIVVSQAVVAVELRDDRLQIEEEITVFNLGRNAWQPEDVSLSLPAGFTGFNAEATMSDQGVDNIDGAAKLRGTFAPGQHPIEFRWQLPWGGEKDVDFDVGLPPHTAIARILMPASGQVKLTATDFPPTDVRRDSQGQAFLVTERRMRPDDTRLQSIGIAVHDLPTPGPGRLVATTLATVAVALGVLLAFARRKPTGADSDPDDDARSSLLEELALLERAHAAGAVGVRTYERARRELIDALAFVLAARART
jgi:hypothetical protein